MNGKQRVAAESSDKATASKPVPEARAERLDQAYADFEKQKYEWIGTLAEQRQQPLPLVD